MSLGTNTGNTFVDSFAKKINPLEQSPGATPDFDSALEKQFNAAKSQVLWASGDGNSAPGGGTVNGNPAPMTTGGMGTHPKVGLVNADSSPTDIIASGLNGLLNGILGQAPELG